jgi:uncharacterized OsmC-like protein
VKLKKNEERKEEKVQVVLQVEISNTVASDLEGEVDTLLVSVVSTLCLCKHTITHTHTHTSFHFN